MSKLQDTYHNSGVILVDLDGTLAYYDGWQGPSHIGQPIDKMVARVKQWIEDGRTVKIFTARVGKNNSGATEATAAIKKWCKKYIGKELPITNEKDYDVVEVWDDRAIQVFPNSGITLEDALAEAEAKIKK